MVTAIGEGLLLAFYLCYSTSNCSKRERNLFLTLLKLHILYMRGNVPDIAKRVLHARYTVAIGLVRGFRQRGSACLEGALVNSVYIVHVQVDRRWHWLPSPGATAADHHHRVTNPDLGMYAARGSRSTEKLCCRECFFHDIAIAKKHFHEAYHGEETFVKQFASIEKLDTAILYVLELASSLSVLLLAFGLIASMANVLTKGDVLTDNLIMQHIWAWTQCIAIDASVAGTIIRTFRYHHQRERVKTWLYALLSALLLFTAAIVSNIEAVQQTMNISLDSAYTHVFIPVEALIWIRSVAIVLLIVAHAVRHVQLEEKPVLPVGRQGVREKRTPIQPKPTVVNQTVVQEDEQKALPPPKSVQNDNYDRVNVYMGEHPDASARTVGKALGMSATTANKWMNKARIV